MMLSGFEPEDIAQSVIETVSVLGENATFQTSGGDISCRFARNVYMGNTYTSAEKEYAMVGTLLVPEGVFQDTLRGSYFTLETMPGKTYILVSVSEYPYTDRVAEVYVVECNDVVSYANKTEVSVKNPLTGDYDVSIVYEKFNENISVYADLSLNLKSDTVYGSLSNSALEIVVPVDFPITTSNYVVRKEFVPTSKSNPTPIWGEQAYTVESVDVTLLNSMDEYDMYGVLKVRLTKEVA